MWPDRQIDSILAIKWFWQVISGVCFPSWAWKVEVLLSCVQLFVTPWAIACQPPLPMGFSRQEYWSELSFSPPGDLPHPGIDPESSALQADSLASEQFIWLLDCIFEYFFKPNHNKVLQLWTICCINLCGPEILIYYQVTYWTFLSHSRGTHARRGGCWA